MGGDADMPDAPPPSGASPLPAAKPAGTHITYGEAGAQSSAEALAAAKQSGNITVQDANAETLALPAGSQHAKILQEEALRQAEQRRRIRATMAPTADADVRRVLRQIGHPVTLFGEREMERRDRLRKLLAMMGEVEREAALARAEEEMEALDQDSAPKELFYTEGPPTLRDARLQIARFSMERAAARLAAARRRRESADEDEDAEADEAVSAARRVVNQCSEMGDERPLAAAAFSPDGAVLATAAWSGLLKLWALPTCTKLLTIRAHSDRITGAPPNQIRPQIACIAWHPDAAGQAAARSNSAGAAPAADAMHVDVAASNSGDPSGLVQLATGGADCTLRLWGPGGAPLRTLAGHTMRLGRVAFHPMGAHVGSASFDGTWRLWDAEAGACLLEQEGHSREVYALAFHPDGALAASGGLDAIGRVWDMRTGRSIMVLEGHVKALLALDFAPGGGLLASGSEDHTARVWDLRQRRCLYTLPGHRSLVSQVRFEPSDGHVLLTAGYDCTAKLWAARDWQLARTLAGHEGRVMGADVAPDGSGLIATVSYDRTVKLWAPEDPPLEEP